MKNMKSCLILVLIASLIFSFVGCDMRNKGVVKDGNLSQNAVLYFANSDYNNMMSENRTVFFDDEDKFSEAVLKELLKGPVDTTLRAVIPQGTTINKFFVEGLVATVDFSAEYFEFSGDNAQSAELLARYSVVKTLCALDKIDRVYILVEGEPLLNQSGNVIGSLGESDIVFTQNSEENVTKKIMTLYFADAMGEELVAERRRVAIVDNNMAKTVVAELIKGPVADDVYATIPKETKVLSVETKEGICFVNLSEEFITKFSGGSSAATMAIYSVVNSLTELPDIDRVQFLVDGVKVETFGDYIFSEPFERDKHILQ